MWFVGTVLPYPALFIASFIVPEQWLKVVAELFIKYFWSWFRQIDVANCGPTCRSDYFQLIATAVAMVAIVALSVRGLSGKPTQMGWTKQVNFLNVAGRSTADLLFRLSAGVLLVSLGVGFAVIAGTGIREVGLLPISSLKLGLVWSVTLSMSVYCAYALGRVLREIGIRLLIRKS